MIAKVSNSRHSLCGEVLHTLFDWEALNREAFPKIALKHKVQDPASPGIQLKAF